MEMDIIARIWPPFDLCVHGICTKKLICTEPILGTIVKTKEGTWRAQVRRKGKYASSTFRVKSLADEWMVEVMQLSDMCHINPEQRTLQTIDKPLGARVSPMS
jgi:hypothetical protein